MRAAGRPHTLTTCILLSVLVAGSIGEARAQQRRGDREKRGGEQGVFLTEIPEYRGNVILGRPTDRSVTLSIFSRDAARITVAYGQVGKTPERQTAAFDLTAGEPREVVLEGLEPNTAYVYRVLNVETGERLLPEKESGTFRTSRSSGSSFLFTVQSDPHLDGGCLPDLYKTSLANALSDKPDFLLDLGDTFMTGKHGSRESAAKQYAAQRFYFGLVGHAVPVFLVLGNHDGEEVRRGADAEEGGLAVWSCLQRKRLFPNPAPNGFYTGNTERHPWAGLLENYYAWTWGDALFVVLDPYWTSRSGRGGKEPWNMTIGKAQYDWLAATLRTSKAKYKFVFIHQLTGGLDGNGRGGAEAARLFEWGGQELGGQNTFVSHRPDWEKPIHGLLLETGVTMVFHGHDHFFAQQDLDGIVYQLVPQPAHRNFQNHSAEEYGYKQGHFLPSSGCVRVRVAPDGVTVEYVRGATPDIERRGIRNGEVAYRYSIPMRTGR